MLPFDVAWYRRLLRFAIVLGIAGGVLGLIYMGGTDWAIARVFPKSDGAVWSGEWWWIPVVAVGGLIVVGLRQAWNVPEKVPGGVAIIEAAEIDHKATPIGSSSLRCQHLPERASDRRSPW